MKRSDSVKSPLLRQYKQKSAITDLAFETRRRSNVQRGVNDACSDEAAVIFEIARAGSLDEKISLEHQLQQRDLEKYAKSDSETRGVKQGLKDMTAALVAYAGLTKEPKEYKRYAASYTDRNRDARLDVPKDGMRYALSSQITRLQNRLSLQLSEEEKVLITARRALLDSVQKEYSDLQKSVLHD